MGDVKTILKTTVLTLAAIWGLNQISITRNLVQTALNGQ